MAYSAHDPALSSGSENSSSSVLRYPLLEDPEMTTSLRFVRYDRLAPDDTASERTTSLITLPIPTSVPDASSIRTTSQHDLKSVGNINNKNLEALFDGKSLTAENATMSDLRQIGSSIISQQLSGGILNMQDTALRAVALAPGLPDDTRSSISSFAGIVKNPHTTLLFEGVNLKSFSLDWRMSPRSKEESDQLRSIVDEIKFRSHPEEITNGYVLNYPDLVYVEFNGPSSNYLPRFQKAFINNIVVTSDSGSGIAFYDSGAPIMYNIQISMTELNIVTRTTLESQTNARSA